MKVGTHQTVRTPNSLTQLLEKLYSVPGESNRLRAMEGIRGYAALIVFFVHYSWDYAFHDRGIELNQATFIQLLEQDPTMAPWYWAFSSHYGVDLFFLMSGYLVANMVRKTNFRFVGYYRRRIQRLYPILIISTFLYVGFSLITGFRDYSVSTIIANLLLLNGVPGLHFVAINEPTWSLFFEFAFYTSFPFIWKLARGRLLIVWLLSGLVLLPLYAVSEWYIRFLMFLAGISLQVLPGDTLRQWRARVPESAVIVAYLLSTTLFVLIKNLSLFIPIYMVTAALLLDSALHREGLLQKLFSQSWLRYLGNMSYSIYLFQVLALMFARTLLVRLELADSPFFSLLHFFISLATTLVLATLGFALVEKRYYKRKK